MTTPVTQIIVDAGNFAAVEKYLEGNKEKLRSQGRNEFEKACRARVDYIRDVLVMRDKSRVKDKVVVEVTVQGLDTLEGQIDYSVDLTSYMPDLEKLGATYFGSHQSQND